MTNPTIRRALISVSQKMGLVDFALELVGRGVEIVSTGGTARHLADSGIPVIDISTYTRFPEMMDGRLKTLHPKVHGGILCRHDRPEDMESLAAHDIAPFELVVVNLYPFEATVAREGVTDAEAIEQIDIGGPTLVRAAAKNHTFVTVVTDFTQYASVMDEIRQHGHTALSLRRELAWAAFARTARYDQAIADYFAEDATSFPPELNLHLTRKGMLRYGENPHQAAAIYTLPSTAGPSVLSARQLHGKPLSYNNLLDLDSALAIVRSLPAPGAVVIKHNNPCGAATAEHLADAARRACDGDPQSAFGSVLGFNQEVNLATAEVLAEPDRFVEAIVAPAFDDGAFELLTTKPKWKNNVRLLAAGPLQQDPSPRQWRSLEGGFLRQDADLDIDPEHEWTVKTNVSPSDGQWSDLRFTWTVCRHVKSNAIAVGRNNTILGVGAGQMSRVDSVEIALAKAGSRGEGGVLASDAFFPFDDSIHRAAQAGIAAVIQPGGSRRDQEVIDACDAHGLAMVFTGRRHFRH